ncbi:YppF family protein [Mesobacillus maritimus]|uniref:YppF family protein n=1 Tax=Mesobacillus maritimus TaxID=1643336 RepID=UPI00203EB75C|nr:YppF family protein [Mesobacillus maritimus]MCM3669425.1 YppF family protein [Mesobacillus maritimus]
MTVQDLSLMFSQVRKYSPEHVNDLLDFAKRLYVQNEISFHDYRLLVRDLELQGAFIPEDLKQYS